MKNLDTISIPVRYSIPNKLDLAPYASVCKVIDDNGHTSHYLQTAYLSSDCQHASWSKIGDLLEDILKDHYSDPLFINACLIKSIKPLY
jgi:hypothetical protein